MAHSATPVTPAVRVLRGSGVPFTEHLYATRSTAARGCPRASSASTSTPSSRRSSWRTTRARRSSSSCTATARSPRSSSRAQIGAQARRAVQAGGRQPALGLPGRRHVALRHAEGDARSTSSARSSTCRASTSTAARGVSWSASRPADLVRVLNPTPVEVGIRGPARRCRSQFARARNGETG